MIAEKHNMIAIDINKTIVVTNDDVTEMIKFCKDAEGNISKSFYDWYLKDEPEYFTKSGMLVIDLSWGRVPISFDLSDPDEVEFIVYNYKDQSIVSKFFFYRQDNITMKDVTIDIEHYFSKHFEAAYRDLKGKSDKSNPVKTDNELDRIIERAKQRALLTAKRYGNHLTKGKVHKIIDQALTDALSDLNKKNCRDFVYSLYSLMYYVSTRQPEEITASFHRELQEATETKKYIYKYTGYIDLRESKIYKPMVEKNPNEPSREYQRHIDSWIVRGHYRKTKKGLIWIDEHIKGKGELEKRIYGTEDEKDLNLIPKIFEVERVVKAEIPKQIEIVEQEPKPEINVVPVVMKKEKPNFFKRLFMFIRNSISHYA